jgi:DNA-binding Lrp family transcriptional regulator
MPRGRKKTLTPALEDYLAVIQEILQKQPAARVSTIARKMGVSLPSVTNAMKRLAELGYVEYEKYGYITLTEIVERFSEQTQELFLLRDGNTFTHRGKTLASFLTLPGYENERKIQEILRHNGEFR